MTKTLQEQLKAAQAQVDGTEAVATDTTTADVGTPDAPKDPVILTPSPEANPPAPKAAKKTTGTIYVSESVVLNKIVLPDGLRIDMDLDGEFKDFPEGREEECVAELEYFLKKGLVSKA
jgi:hypothetical protein